MRVQGRTYPLNGVDGVDIEPPHRLVYIAGAMIAACTAPVVLHGGSTPGAIALAAVAAVLLLATLNRPYALILRTARGTQQPLAHPNRKFVQSVKQAIEEALSARA